MNPDLRKRLEQVLKDIETGEPKTPEETDRLTFVVSDALKISFSQAGVLLMEYFREVERRRVTDDT